MKPETWTAIGSVVGAVALIATLWAIVRSNRQIATASRLDTLQQMVVEMNVIRRLRSDDPDLERSLFAARGTWTDQDIRHHLAAVQLANILEWAYLARKEGLLARDVWESWAETWRSVILASKPLQDSFEASVWTFGRAPETRAALERLVTAGSVEDPRKAFLQARWRVRADRESSPTSNGAKPDDGRSSPE